MIDIVSLDLFAYKNIEEILLSLGISTVYVCKSITKKEEQDFSLPVTKKIILKKAVLLNNLELVKTIKDNTLILVKGGTLKQNFSILNNKQNILLFDPIGEDLCFDESSAVVSKQNNKIIYFNLNNIRTNQYKTLKQMQFIIPLLKSKKIEMRFVTLAKHPKELIDSKILECFLKNFSLDKETINNFLNKEI